jgi:hypothetical protein
MTRSLILPITCLLAALFCAYCGGGAPEPVAPAGPPQPSGDVTMSEPMLTTDVDPDTKQPAAEVTTSFSTDTKQIFLVTTIENLPPDTEVEVKWLSSAKSTPIHISSSTATGTYFLVAKLLPPMGSFEPGTYQAYVYVNNQRLGGLSFRVGAKESRWTGVRELNLSGAVRAFTNEALDARTSFHQGITKIYVTFLVRTDDENPYVRVSWSRDDDVFLENDIECGGEVRCADVYETKKPIPGGDYEVAIDVNGDVLSHKTFHVGGKPVGPVIDFAALGAAKGKKKMPRGKDGPVALKSGVKGIRVGFRLLTLPDEARVKVAWVSIGTGEQLYANEVEFTGGGEKSEVVDWEPESPLEPGDYKAVIKLGDRVMEELGFTIE